MAKIKKSINALDQDLMRFAIEAENTRVREKGDDDDEPGVEGCADQLLTAKP